MELISITAPILSHFFFNVRPCYGSFIPGDSGCLYHNCHISCSFLFLLPPSPPSRCTGAIVKHWPESRALRRLRGSGLTDRWISPQSPRMGIVREAFLSLWDPCGLRIPGFCAIIRPHTEPKENTVKLCTASSIDAVHGHISLLKICWFCVLKGDLEERNWQLKNIHQCIYMYSSSEVSMQRKLTV